jgi:hypothetical protein
MDDAGRNRHHRALGLDLGLNAGRSQTIAAASALGLRSGGRRTRARRASAAGLTIPPPSADIMNLKISKP